MTSVDNKGKMKKINLDAIVVMIANNIAVPAISNVKSDVFVFSLLMSDSYFDREKLIKDGVHRFVVTTEYLLISYSNQPGSTSIRLARSILSQIDQLKDINVDDTLTTDTSFTLIDSRSYHIALKISKHDNIAPYGTVYISDSAGIRFAVGISMNVNNGFGYSDFDTVAGMPTVYIANVYDAESFRLMRYRRQTIDQKTDGLTDRDLLIKTTRISYDRGVTWIPLGMVMNGRCQEKRETGCALHLNSLTEVRSGQILSAQTSPGMLIATGNEGNYLGEKDIGTYISEDVGLTWRLLLPGDHIYDISDQGGLFVLVETAKPTNSIKFSWDKGTSFSKMQVSDRPFFATKVQTDKSNTGLVFIIHGVLDSEDHLGMIISVDFSRLMPRLCQIEGLADFDLWTPEFSGNR